MNAAAKTEIEHLRRRLAEAEEALRAIRAGEVDAVLAPGPGGDQVFTLRGADHPYRVFLEHMQEGAAALDAEGVILYANRRLAEMLRAPLEKVIGATFGRWIPQPARSVFRRFLEESLRGSARVELTLEAADGAPVPVCLSGAAPRPAGAPALCLVVTDLTEPRRREQQLLQQAAMLEEARQQLERQAGELARSNAELEQFAGVVAHDLAEPLRMVANYCRLLESRYGEQLDGKGRRFLRYAAEGAERMQTMLDGLLEYSRVSTRGGRFAPVDLQRVFDEACDDLRATIEAVGARVAGERLPAVWGDEPQLLRLLENLIGNALKFTGPQAPEVRVFARRQGERWRIAVQDNGIGIAPEDRERIFGIFQRGHARSAYPGEGLGLAIARRIVERHGGRIWVESEPGQGATFYFTLPGVAAAEEGQARVANAG